MSPNANASVLEEALACIGQRIAAILMHPADKDKDHIVSLRNEVVGVFSAWERMQFIKDLA
jgi:hypothetical protein